MRKKIIHKKKEKIFLFLLFFSFFIFLPKVSLGDEGDLIWEKAENLTGGTDHAFGVAVDSTGVYAAGYQNNGDLWRVEKRSLIDGSLIWEKAVDLSGGNDYPMEVAVDSTGVYAVGSQNNGALWRVEKRSLTDGSLIWQKVEDLSGGVDSAQAADIDSTGLYVAGSQASLWRIEKRSPTDGSLIWEKEKDFGFVFGPSSKVEGIAVNSTGVFLAGLYRPIHQTTKWRVEKRSPTDGSLIWEKTTSGCVPIEVAVDPTGVYVVGNQDNSTLWRVEKRSLTDGSLIWQKVENLSGGVDSARGVATDSTGVYITGGQNNDALWRVEKRSLTDGSLIWKKEEDFSGGIDRAQQVDFYSNGLYIVGSQNNRDIWRVERRIKIPEYIDIGLRVYNGTETVVIAVWPFGQEANSPLRIAKNGIIYGIVLVNPGDPNDSGVRIRINSATKALRKYP